MSEQVRTYGGWRERRGFGMAGLSGPQTAGALLCAVVCLAVALIAPASLVVMAVPLLIALAMVGLRFRGEAVASVAERRGRWWWSQRRATGSYRSGSSQSLPGVLKDSKVLEVMDRGGCGVAVVWDSVRETVTAVVPVEPFGVDLVGPQEVQQWVTGWGEWLAHLGYVPELRHLAVTVHTGPGPPGPDANGATAARTLLSLTIGGAGSARLEQACEVLLDVVASTSALARCGLTLLPAMTASEVARWVRHAFDPDLQATDVLAEPGDLRPTATEEMWGTYRHDAALSAGYVWHEPPGPSAGPGVLARLLGPADYWKRLTLVFEPVPAHAASREVDRQAEAAVFRREYRRRLGRDETARERVDLQRARQTADEQAAGAGLVDVGLYAVATAGSEAAVLAAAADLENRAGESRLRLRRNYGAQAATFACTLGIGYVPGRRW